MKLLFASVLLFAGQGLAQLGRTPPNDYGNPAGIEKRFVAMDPCTKSKLGPLVVTKRGIFDLFKDPCAKNFQDQFVVSKREDKRFAAGFAPDTGFAPFDPCDKNKLGDLVMTKRKLFDMGGSSLFWDPCNKHSPFDIVATRSEEKRVLNDLTTKYKYDPCEDSGPFSNIVTKRKLLDVSGGNSLFWDPCNHNNPWEFVASRSIEKRVVAMDPCTKSKLGPLVMSKRGIFDLFKDPCAKKIQDQFVVSKREDKRFAAGFAPETGFAPFDPCDKNNLGDLVMTKRKLFDIGGNSLFWDPCNKQSPFDIVATRSEAKRAIADLTNKWDPCADSKSPFGNIVVTKRRLMDVNGGNSLFWDPCNHNNPWDLITTRSEGKRDELQNGRLANGFAPNFDPCDEFGNLIATKRGVSLFGDDPCANKNIPPGFLAVTK